MESEAISIDEYLDSDAEQRFDFLYENYAVLKAIIKDYREDIITDVIEMKSFNRRAANGELGVRVQVSMGTSNPTLNKAINNITIAKAVDEGYLDEDCFEDTDKPFGDFSVELGIDYQSAVKRIGRIKHKLIERVEPRLRRGEYPGRCKAVLKLEKRVITCTCPCIPKAFSRYIF